MYLAQDSPLRFAMFKFDFNDFTAPLFGGQGYGPLDEGLQRAEFAVAAPFVAIGAKAVSVSQALMNGDDYAGDATTTGVLEIGGDAIVISNDFDRDVDWLALDGFEEGQDLRLIIDFSSGFGELNMLLSFIDEDGNRVDGGYYFPDELPPISIDDRAAFLEIVYLQYFGEITSLAETYSMRFIDVSGDDYAGDTTTSGVLEASHDSIYLSNNGTLGEIDRDWIAIDIHDENQINTLYWDDYNAVVRIVDETGQNQFLTSFSYAFRTEPGRYYVEVIHPATTNPGATGFELNLQVKYDDYAGDESSTARLGEDGSSIFLSHDSVSDLGESDFVGVELAAGELITISAELGSLSEVLFLNSSGWDSPELDIPFVVQETGLYFIQVGHFFSPENIGDGTTLSIRREIADYSADVTTRGSILINGTPTQSQLEEVGDVDWFAVTVEAGDAVNFGGRQ